MIQLISRERHGGYMDGLAERHRLRGRVRNAAPNWDVLVTGDISVDELDALRRACLLQHGGRTRPLIGRAMQLDSC